MTNDLKLRRHNALLVIYLLFALIFFLLVALPVMNGTMDFQFYADSKTYEEEALYKFMRGDFFDFANNSFGPVQILLLLGPRNYFLIFLFNVTLFLLALKYLSASCKSIDRTKLYTLIFLSPITFTSLMSINKEMIALLCVALIIYNHTRKRWAIALILILLTYLVRWQFTGFYLIYLLIFSKINFLRNHRLIVFVIFLLITTAVLFVARDSILAKVFARFDNTVDSWDEGRGTFAIAQGLQDNYGYIVAFVPKVLLLLCGMITRYSLFFDFSDVYNNFITYLQTIWNIFILYFAYKGKCMNMKMSDDFFYIALIYCAIYAITPIFCTRYFYPGMLFLCYAIAQKCPYQKVRVSYSSVSQCK